MFDVVLTPAERALLDALTELGVPYLIVGMSAALIEGAPGTGGVYTSGFGIQPPAVGGEGLDRIDIVLTASGLDTFEEEFQRSREYEIDGLRVKVLPLERVIVSKRGEAGQGHRPDPDARGRSGCPRGHA